MQPAPRLAVNLRMRSALRCGAKSGAHCGDGGIGHPPRFFSPRCAFRGAHPQSASCWLIIKRLAPADVFQSVAGGAFPVMTEKDAVKCRALPR
ncbi:hypothetical protein KCP69_19450 [Salmonella enterica subsp. enterica]|nr:hypothetical protein KCP69_19450 [Salmonella enterica subsp. enterica]